MLHIKYLQSTEHNKKSNITERNKIELSIENERYIIMGDFNNH
jgi:endonuclease/exonuclease/phosphatase family metal-dependent hydrolase